MSRARTVDRAPWRWWCALGAALVVSLSCAAPLQAQIEPPRPDKNETIEISAQEAHRWTQGPYEVWWLTGQCALKQGATVARGNEAVLWIKRSGEFGDRQNFVTAYFEGQVQIDYQRAGFPYKLQDATWFGEFFSTAPVVVRTPPPRSEPAVKPAVFQRAQARRDPLLGQSIHRTQFQPEGVPAPAALPSAGRRLRAYPRGGARVQASWFSVPERQEWVAVITSGVNLIVDNDPTIGTLDIAADRLVLWTRGAEQPDLAGQTAQAAGTPMELYLEGNVTFRQGDRVIYANRVYYDVNNQLGTLVEADLNAPVPSYLGVVRLKSDLIQQVGKNRFVARETSVTTSKFELPTYRLQAREMVFEDEDVPVIDGLTGTPVVDEEGEQVIDRRQTLTSNGNFVYVGPVPVFYWPTFATDLEEPSMFIRQLTMRQDNIYGTQFLSRFDAYQMLGIKRKPKGTSWTISADYFSYRGFAGGTNFRYSRDELFGLRGPARGFIDAWGLPYDGGTDTLGSDRMNLSPEKVNRGRIEARHQQELANGWRLKTESWLITDRNFLEQYFERDWDTEKDFTTGGQLKRLDGNMSYGVNVDMRPNGFLTQTEQLPRGDHYWLGQSFLADRLTYYEHTSAGYYRERVAGGGLNPVDALKEQPLAWMVSAQGARVISTHEVDAPVDLGPFKVVPYALGQYGYWGQDLQLNSVDRLYGQAGIRANIPFWRVDPTIESSLLNVHGLAHKVVLDGDLSVSDANTHLNNMTLYDPLDDDAQEVFRERMRYNIYNQNGTMPAQFDERFYALRSGLASSVTSPASEIADRFAAFRFGARQRLQTKRGRADNRRIIDWMTLDAGATLFPNPNRDNFGQALGLANYDYRWYIGDRLSLVSSGQFDFFNQGQKIATFGITLTRPPRGQLYLGFYAMNGPITADVLSTFYSYRLSPKWLSSAGITYDLAGNGLVGNQLSLTRIGEAFLTNFNFVADPYKHNVGINFMIEPRIIPRSRFGNVGGQALPVAGASGLE
ncbi:MAG: hypothetical protein JSS27_09425 [Planctomycetes bacterium]|nr:hypothetical protein [Planctomycetota bacterium]